MGLNLRGIFSQNPSIMKTLITLFLFASMQVLGTVYYYDGAGSVTLVTNWGVNTDGSGTNPICFCSGHEYILTNTASVNFANPAGWAFITGSQLTVGDDTQGDCELTVSTLAVAGITGNVSVTGGSKLIYELISLPTATFVDMDIDGTVEYLGDLLAAQAVKEGTYGNLTLTGVGLVDLKEMPDTIIVNGNLTLDAAIEAILGNAYIKVQGDLTIQDDFAYTSSSETKTDFEFLGTSNQTISAVGGAFELRHFNSTKTGGILSLSNTDLTIHGDVNLSASGGTLDPGTGNLFIAEDKVLVGTGHTLRMSSGGQFVAQDTVDNAGIITVEKGATDFSQTGSFVQLEGSVYINNGGTFGIKNRVGWTDWGRYTYWSSPVVGGLLNEVGGFTANYYFQDMAEGDDGWLWSSFAMEAGRGYVLQEVGGDSVFFQGTPNNGPISGPDAGLPGGQAEAWSLLGNPYPSPINAKDFLDSNSNINGAVYIWDQGSFPDQWGFVSTEYSVVNGTGASWVGGAFVDTLDASTFWISPYQGFFVEGVGTAAAVQFDNGMRDPALDATPTWTFKSGEKKKIWVQLRDPLNLLKTEALVGFLEGATEGWDNLYDARPNSSGFHLASLVGDQRAVIQGLPPFTGDEVIQWEALTNLPGEYEFVKDRDFNLPDDVWLKDLSTDEVVKLTEEPLVFTQELGNAFRFFEMYFKDPSTVGVQETFNTSSQFAQKENTATVNANGTISVFDTGGRLIDQYDLILGEELRTPSVSGVYLFKFQNSNSTEVLKMHVTR
ncbi:MAG: hypothetical protein ACI9YL_000223 [Luteibaculaceae bacterium]|jgi:hypothetical protein